MRTHQAALFLFPLCVGACQGKPEAAVQDRFEISVSGSVEFSWHAAENQPDGMTVSDMAVTPRGGYAALDWIDGELASVTAAGLLDGVTGQPGEGRGDLGTPCCLMFPEGDGTAGLLYEVANHRYARFEVNGGRPVIDRVIVAPAEWSFTKVVASPAPGEILHPSLTSPTPGGDTQRLVLSRLDSLGLVASVDTVALPPDGQEARVYASRSASSSSAVGLWIYQPFGSRRLYAIGPRGDVAQVFSGSYRVDWRMPDGSHRAIGDSTRRGPPVSQVELTEAGEALDNELQSIGWNRGDLPFGIPDRKAPVQSLEFDNTGRLWVFLSVPAGADVEADVYGRGGEPIGRFVWPSQYRLLLKTVRGDALLAWTEDENGFRQYYKVTFHRRTD